jgi:hypothetical protein
MTANRIQALIALNLLAALLAAASIYSSNKVSIIDRSTQGVSAADLSERLSGKIGDQYTADIHSKVADLLVSDEAKDNKILGVLHDQAGISLTIGTVLVVLCTMSTLILAVSLLQKKRQNKAEMATPRKPSD